MKNQNIRNFIDDVQDTLLEKKYPVHGFSFVLDRPFDVQEEVFPLKKGMPRVKGFLYVDKQGKRHGDDS